MDRYDRKQTERRGHGVVEEVLHTATILHKGWEMDNEGWIAKMEDGTTKAFTTSHGGVYPWTKEELEKKIAETENSLAELKRALEFFPS